MSQFFLGNMDVRVRKISKSAGVIGIAIGQNNMSHITS